MEIILILSRGAVSVVKEKARFYVAVIVPENFIRHAHGSKGTSLALKFSPFVDVFACSYYQLTIID